MKFITFIKKYGLVVYIMLIVSAAIFSTLGFSVIDTAVIWGLKILYFIILICAIVSIYHIRRKNATSIVLLILPIILLFTDIPFKVVTMILMLPLFFFNKVKTSVGGIGATIYIVLISIGIYGIALGDFGADTIIDQQYSPNRMYRVVAINSDQGALGGDTYVELENIYLGIIKRNTTLLYHGHFNEKLEIKWIDNNIVNINGRDMNIHTSDTWNNRH